MAYVNFIILPYGLKLLTFQMPEMQCICKFVSILMSLGNWNMAQMSYTAHVYSVTMGTSNSQYADIWFLLTDIIFLSYIN